MDQIELNERLAKHALWIEGYPNGARADLFGADLSKADLSKADLSGADLFGVCGICYLTQTEHGYHVIAQKIVTGWTIYAGCREFSIAAALAHWSDPSYHTPASGRKVVACIEWLQGEIARGEI
jgi:hypothetical protein